MTPRRLTGTVAGWLFLFGGGVAYGADLESVGPQNGGGWGGIAVIDGLIGGVMILCFLAWLWLSEPPG